MRAGCHSLLNTRLRQVPCPCPMQTKPPVPHAGTVTEILVYFSKS
jgi:hypothetical protein